MNKIILWEYQKKRICEHYACSDSFDLQYPSCEDVGKTKCQLHQIQRLLYDLNQPLEEEEYNETPTKG